MRQLALNALTAAVTVALLVALAIPAKEVLDENAARRAVAADSLVVAPARHPHRLFGVYVDPWHVDDWAAAVGAVPQAIGSFEAFSRGRTLRRFASEAARRHVRRLLVSWEPWTPVPSAAGVAAQARPQRGYRNIDVARGACDRYITRFARALAGYPGTVYLRYAHEMNGYWYPWSRGAAAYRWAWRRVVRLVRAAGAHNVRFVWSVNANLYEPAAAWRAGLRRYWPGRRFVDVVGSTMINFGGRKAYSVARFAPRLRTLHRVYRKPMMLTETNTDASAAARWLAGLRRMLAGMPWIRGVFWSQLPSRGTVQQFGSGNLDWDVRRDPAAALQLASIIRDGVSGYPDS